MSGRRAAERPARSRSAGALAAALALAVAPAAGGCRGIVVDPRFPLPAPLDLDAAPVAEVRRGRWPGGALARETHVLVHPDGSEVRHGPERLWWRDGTPRAERAYAHGEPTGTWTSRWPGGARRGVVPLEDGVATWWREDGQVEAEGPMRAGHREGRWTHWHATGHPAAHGAYRASLRDGSWTLWRPDGSLEAEGAYHRGQRVGTWTLYDARGRPLEREADALPEAPG